MRGKDRSGVRTHEEERRETRTREERKEKRRGEERAEEK